MLFGYMRVSTADERQSVDLQHDALIKAGVDPRHLFQDRVSGAKTERPGLRKCLADMRDGDTLIVWKLDRLGRSLSHLIRIIEQLKTRRIAFRSLTEGIDTTSSHGEFLLNLFGTLAQYERALITERVNAGLAAARKRGRSGGRPLAINEEKFSQIILTLESGASKASVCRAFNIPRSTLLDTLKRKGWTDTDGKPEETNGNDPD